jgi:hypothetical protein
MGAANSAPGIDRFLRIGFLLAIVLLWLGGIGGSLQPSRLALLLLAPIAVSVLFDSTKPKSAVIAWSLASVGCILALGCLSLLWAPSFTDGASRLLVVAIGMSAFLCAAAMARSIESARAIRDAWALAGGFLRSRHRQSFCVRFG